MDFEHLGRLFCAQKAIYLQLILERELSTTLVVFGS